MSNYYQKQDSKVAIMSVLLEKGWAIFGYKPDESDLYSDYWSPARWGGIASKNGFVLVVDQHSTHYSGYEVKEYDYNAKGTSSDNYAKIQKLQATLNDVAATENEKVVCAKKIEALENKEGVKPSYTVKETYPTFAFANPKACTWHIEKDGEIVAKGKGLTNIYEINSRENTRSNAEKFVSKIESKINGLDALVPVQKAVIKKVIKPVLVTDRKELKVGDVLSFEYHGHFWEVYSVNDTTFSYELLGSEKRGYMKRKNPKRYYDYLSKFETNLEKGIIKIYELKEVEEVTYKTVYVKAQRKGQQENLLSTEEVMEVEEVTEVTEGAITTDNITLEIKENEEKQGIELYFSGKPSKNVIGMLKESGFRWSKRGFWYAKKTEERSILAESVKSIYADITKENETIENVSVESQEVVISDTVASEKSNKDINEEVSTVEEKLAADHVELQEKGMALTESKPEINKEATYKVIVSKDRENNLIGEFEKVLTGKELEFQLFMNEVLEIKEEINNKKINVNDDIEVTEEVKVTVENTVNTDNAVGTSFVHNTERNSIEVKFDGKPCEEIRSLLKAHGFRWAKYNKVWYKKNPHANDFILAESLAGEKNENNGEFEKATYPEIEINDIKSYTIPQDIQDRENDSNWITRSVKRDHNKELQNEFTSVQNEVESLLNQTENKGLQHELKRSLQSFKKNYHATYLKWITAKANTPSWITTGRGGMNVASYNKKMTIIDNHMLKLSEIKNKMDDTIRKVSKRIIKEEKTV